MSFTIRINNMSRSRDKELETLNKITGMQKDLLGSLYGDFFSAPVSKPSERPRISKEKMIQKNLPAKHRRKIGLMR